jgi:hypothetical protein
MPFLHRIEPRKKELVGARGHETPRETGCVPDMRRADIWKPELSLIESEWTPAIKTLI